MDNGNGSSATDAKSFGIGTFLIGILAGAIIGGVAALLLTPKTGAESREICMTQLNKLRDIVRPSTQTGQETPGEGMTT